MMKKRIALVLVLMLICTTFSGCLLTGILVSEIIEDQEVVGGVGETLESDTWNITLLEAKTYDNLSSSYLPYAPGEGNEYVVLFFDLENISSDTAYFFSSDIECYADGYAVNPVSYPWGIEGYSALDGTVAEDKRMKGYMVWEVSSDWTELEVSYQEYSSKKLTFLLTPGDVSNG